MIDYLASSLVTLIVVADPILLSAISLGVTGRAVSTRMLGIILAAMAVQFVIDGVETVVSTAP